MTPLALHIEYLLLRHDCVIIPGLGAFVAEYVPASIDDACGLIIPPLRKISFNPVIQQNDGILNESIARKEQTTSEEASILLESYINDIERSLRTIGEYSIGNLGRLVYNDDSRSIEFLSRLSSVKRAEAGGNPVARLSEEDAASGPSELITDKSAEEIASLVETTLTDDTPQINEGVSIGKNKDKNAADSNENTELPPHTYLKLLSDKNYYLPINKIFARCAAAFIIIAAIAVSFIVPPAYNSNDEVKASLNPVESLSSRSAIATKIDSERITGNVSDPERADSKLPDEETEIMIEESPSGQYLIVATFKNLDEAISFIEQRNGGDYPLQVVSGKSLWRVSAGHGDYSTLRTILNSSEFRAAFSEAWIWNAGE